jgi:hypothetical protein
MLAAESVLGTVGSVGTASLFFLSVPGGSFCRMHPFQQQLTVLHREYLTAPKIPRHSVVAPPIIASMSAVLVTTFPIFLSIVVKIKNGRELSK